MTRIFTNTIIALTDDAMPRLVKISEISGKKDTFYKLDKTRMTRLPVRNRQMKAGVFTNSIMIIGMAILIGCTTNPKGNFVPDAVPPTPDYSDESSWAALPGRLDSADLLPSGDMVDRQMTADVDVFFLHPTTYIGKKGDKMWNADVDNEKLNVRTDKSSIKYQATIFNGVGRVYAPRYRQAHLEAFYTKKKKADAAKALAVAYEDVKAAFEYYMDHYNEGRPIVIACHSQGTLHAAKLMKEYFDGGELKDKLVAAYLIGMPVKGDFFTEIPACETPEQTGCYCTWRTVKDGYYPKKFYVPNANIIVTNPLTWTLDKGYAPAELNSGAVLKKFHKGPIDHFIDARADDGLLMVSRPKIPGVPVLPSRNYHVADMNFFYVNIRENAQLRVESYFRDRK
ncbi:MAG: DUF3089 domain-containing protein [Bacteroidetes bacterium]|nr:MAG: DUF3089 domain-containing protein [Bacteroidota bacterium]